MAEKRGGSLNKRLMAIALAAFLPMLFVLTYALLSLANETHTYSDITQSITYANQTMDFKERLDYSMYLAVVRKKAFEDLGDGETTVNGIVTVNPYESIKEMEKDCSVLSDMATVNVNKNEITRLNNTLESLKQNVKNLERMAHGGGNYEKNMVYLDENIYMLTSVIQDGILEYIRVETTNLSNVRTELEQHNARIYVICICTAIAAIGLAVLLTYKALGSVTGPIRKLCNLTQKVAEGDFTVKSKLSNIEEIAVLSQNFNDMTEEIGALVENIKEKEKNLHLMETQLLQAQINPHFLYNTLDTIIWLAEANRNWEVVTMVGSLSDFFRTTLCQGRDYITVKEERSHIESYLNIQQFRYQDIMDYEIHMEDSILTYIIPKLLLQPLVENALYHGVKMKRGKSLIRVTGLQEGKKLIFKVTDNGKGMNHEELAALRANMHRIPDERTGDGFGVANINQRIQHYYGEEYGLYIESEEGRGTEATIVIEAKDIQNFS